MKSNLVNVSMFIHRRTEKAIAASDDADSEKAVWLPLSQIEIEGEAPMVVVTMPEWLAKEKGLI